MDRKNHYRDEDIKDRDVRTPINIIVRYRPRSKEYCASLDLKHMVLETDGTGVVWHEKGTQNRVE